MKKEYLAPSAEIICLAPAENIAAWKPWFEPGDSWWLNSWGLTKEQVAGASINGTTQWYDLLDSNGNPSGNSELD